MANKLSTIHEQIEGSGRATNDQIATAARDFATASERMNEMFASLNDRISDTGRAIDDYDGSGITKFALRLTPHVFVRPDELRHAEWSEVDLEKALWTIPAGKMKMRKAHHVPLSRQVVELLREIQVISGPEGYVFPSVRTRRRPMSENTINGGLRRLGYASDEMTAHGDRDKVRAAYHRGAHWAERVRMSQWWSDHLDMLRAGVANKE